MKRSLPVVGATTLVATALALPAGAQDWTRFRGPLGAGHSDARTVPTEFGPDDWNWRVELPGGGHSSPVVHGGKVFVTSAETEAGAERYVSCLASDDGAELWTVVLPYEPHGQHRLNSFASATPAVDADGVYLAWTSGGTLEALALDHDGEPLWRRELGPSSAQHGSGSSPVLVGDVLVVANDNEGEASFLVGLDRSSGDVVWRRERTTSRAAYSTPIVHAPAGGEPQVIFASTSHGLTALDPRDGAVVWELGLDFSQRCVGSPVVAGPLVFIAAGSGGGGKESAAVRLPTAEDDEPEVAYRLTRALPYVPTPVALGDLLFLWNDGGIVSCVRSATGEEVWRERADGRFFGSPVCVDGRLYAMSMEGELVVLAAKEKFELLGRVDLGEPSQATPAVADGAMYLRTERHLISIGGTPEKK